MPDPAGAPGRVVLPGALAGRLVAQAQRAMPGKVFGYFLATRRFGDPVEYLVMRTNTRDAEPDLFSPYGRYFADHSDAGFVCAPRESLAVERYLSRHGLHKVGVFHSHQRHPGFLTTVDADLHPAPDLWHLLVVLRNPYYPLLRAFAAPAGRRITEMSVVISPAAGPAP
jgi:proteasome lid subunit RPN8/RPN11